MSDRARIARELFLNRKTTGLNCAQAVLKVFQPESGMLDDDIAKYSKAGGGRAEGGVCGALHAVRVLIADAALVESLVSEFTARGGSAGCKEIRKKKILPCGDCVELAADFVEAHIDIITRI